MSSEDAKSGIGSESWPMAMLRNFGFYCRRISHVVCYTTCNVYSGGAMLHICTNEALHWSQI